MVLSEWVCVVGSLHRDAFFYTLVCLGYDRARGSKGPARRFAAVGWVGGRGERCRQDD